LAVVVFAPRFLDLLQDKNLGNTEANLRGYRYCCFLLMLFTIIILYLINSVFN